MNEDFVADIWMLFKEYLDKKHIELAAEKYVDTLIDYGLADDQLQEMLGTTETHILQIDRIWGNVNVDESIMVPHTHKSSLLSGVYYLTPGKLSFLNPFHVTLAHVNQNYIVDYNEYNSDHRFIEMQQGDMIIFNSQIYHFAALTRDERISIACDMSIANDKPNPRDKPV